MNGITLCYVCHIIKLHTEGDKEFLDRYITMVDRLVPMEAQRVMIGESRVPYKISFTDLVSTRKLLERMVNDTREDAGLGPLATIGNPSHKINP